VSLYVDSIYTRVHKLAHCISSNPKESTRCTRNTQNQKEVLVIEKTPFCYNNTVWSRRLVCKSVIRILREEIYRITNGHLKEHSFLSSLASLEVSVFQTLIGCQTI